MKSRIGVLLVLVFSTAAFAQQKNGLKPTVVVRPDGTVEMPAMAVPVSDLLSPEAKAYVAQHLKDMQTPEMLVQDNGVPRFMKGYLQRAREMYPVNREETRIAGVHAYVYTPKGGVKAADRSRVLVNLHGGGFAGCWPGCAELESIPIAALSGIRVISVDYREGPENRFPAASEDVAAVYTELLKRYKPQAIGIYGCSAGGMLTAMSMAWFESHSLPLPSAIGIFCAGAGATAGGGFGGDGAYTAMPLGEARMPRALESNDKNSARGLGYMTGTDPKDPLVSPIQSAEVLRRFPPTLIITATRGFEVSGAIHTNEELSKLGVETELHVWDGLFHGFFYNPDVPESRDCDETIVRFFRRHLRG